MARRYRAKAQLFIDRLIEPGEEFESDLPPGKNWEPLDAVADSPPAASPKQNLKRRAQKAAA